MRLGGLCRSIASVSSLQSLISSQAPWYISGIHNTICCFFLHPLVYMIEVCIYSPTTPRSFSANYNSLDSALDSGLRGLGSRPSLVNAFCSWVKHFTVTLPLSIQECKSILVIVREAWLNAGWYYLVIDWHPASSSNTPSLFVWRKLE